MLIYHFDSRDALVTAIIARVNDRSVEALALLAPAASVRRRSACPVGGLPAEPMLSCEQVYVQATASGLLGEEPYRSGVRRATIVGARH